MHTWSENCSSSSLVVHHILNLRHCMSLHQLQAHLDTFQLFNWLLHKSLSNVRTSYAWLDDKGCMKTTKSKCSILQKYQLETRIELKKSRVLHEHTNNSPFKTKRIPTHESVTLAWICSAFRLCWATLLCQLCSFTTLFPQSRLPEKRSHGEKGFSRSLYLIPSMATGCLPLACHAVCSCLPLCDLLK